MAIATLTCDGATPTGALYDTANMCTGITGLDNVFSGLMCQYESIINEILSNVYCGVQSGIATPLAVALSLYVATLGTQVAMGATQLKISDVMIRFFKVALIWTFATQAAFGVGIAYNFFLSFMDEGITWMLRALMPAPGAATTQFCTFHPPQNGLGDQREAFRYVDYLVCSAVTNPLTTNGYKITGFFSALATAIPPLFALFAFFSFKMLQIFLRTMVTYLLALTAIGFMIVLGPIFLSLGLFRTTYRFFDDWLRHLISFTLQVILIFACLSLWLTVIGTLGGFLTTLAGFLKPIDNTLLTGAFRVPWDGWGLCPPFYPPLAPDACGSKDGSIILPSQLADYPEWANWILVNLTALTVAVYAFDALMNNIPGLARSLAGSGSVMALGQSAPGSGLPFGGVGEMLTAGKGNMSGFADTVGGMLRGNRAEGVANARTAGRTAGDMLAKLREPKPRR